MWIKIKDNITFIHDTEKVPHDYDKNDKYLKVIKVIKNKAINYYLCNFESINDNIMVPEYYIEETKTDLERKIESI